GAPQSRAARIDVRRGLRGNPPARRRARARDGRPRPDRRSGYPLAGGDAELEKGSPHPSCGKVLADLTFAILLPPAGEEKWGRHSLLPLAGEGYGDLGLRSRP